MENKKISKKALQSLLNDSMREAIGHLELPKPTKKVKKLISKSSKRIASEFATILKKENKKAKKTEKSLIYVEDVLTGKNQKDKKAKKAKLEQAQEA
ncbi:MAG: hypothetical protein ACOYXT_19030 [Bacteroidota bacterium]